MPFMKGYLPVRNSLKYLNNSPLVLKPFIRIFGVHYNRKLPSHQALKEFGIWHLSQLQHKNPQVQVISIQNLTPTPFIRIWLDSGKDLVLDVDQQSKDQIHERIVRTLCKSAEEIDQAKAESEVQENPAHFGRECRQHCICEIPGQIPCPGVVPLPYKWRGKYKWGFAELDESKYL